MSFKSIFSIFYPFKSIPFQLGQSFDTFDIFRVVIQKFDEFRNFAAPTPSVSGSTTESLMLSTVGHRDLSILLILLLIIANAVWSHFFCTVRTPVEVMANRLNLDV